MYNHILIATDGSDLATRAVSHGLGLAKVYNSRVTVVTVTERWSAEVMGLEAMSGNFHPAEEYEAIAAAAAKQILDKIAQLAKSQGIACDLVHVRDQPAAEGILATATERGCDLIVMGSQGRRGVDRILVGSRANEVLTFSKVPVLIVR
jgi:nucleotide-binding universal stress UspA family protein